MDRLHYRSYSEQLRVIRSLSGGRTVKVLEDRTECRREFVRGLTRIGGGKLRFSV